MVSCINVLYYRREDLWNFVFIGHFFHEVKPMYFIDLVAILSGFKTSFRTFFVFKTKKHFLIYRCYIFVLENMFLLF